MAGRTIRSGSGCCFEFQRLVGQGYAVLYVNQPRQPGLRRALRLAVRGAWGARDAANLLQALDAALADGAGDPLRLGLTGVSYGACMAHLLLTRTDRFVAAVSENGISDLTSSYHYHAGGGGAAPGLLGLGNGWHAADSTGTLPGAVAAHIRRTDSHAASPPPAIHAELDTSCRSARAKHSTTRSLRKVARCGWGGCRARGT